MVHSNRFLSKQKQLKPRSQDLGRFIDVNDNRYKPCDHKQPTSTSSKTIDKRRAQMQADPAENENGGVCGCGVEKHRPAADLLVVPSNRVARLTKCALCRARRGEGMKSPRKIKRKVDKKTPAPLV